MTGPSFQGVRSEYTGEPIKLKLKPNAAPLLLLEKDIAALGNQAESSGKRYMMRVNILFS
jgi:hypothetical protein